MSSEINLQELMKKINTIESDIREIKQILLIDNCHSNELPLDWQNWINNNLRKGIPKNNIFNILLNHNFDYEIVQKFLKWIPTIDEILDRKMKQKELIINKEFKLSKFNTTLQDNPKIYKIENNFVEIYQIFDFLTLDFCNSLLESFENETFFKSTLTSSQEDNDFRTSSTFSLNLDKNNIYKELNQKINQIIGIDSNLGESVQVQKYEVGQQFKPHTDYFEQTDYDKKHFSRGGQRTWTFMVYLNDVEEGGETNFPRIKLEFKPKIGMAILWNNLINNEKVNHYTLHQGKPILKGVKYIITKWFRQNIVV